MDTRTYETDATGLRIFPGQWRPHYPFEHVAWISPPWPSQDYLWLDFPEAIFSDQGLLYLSHVNPRVLSRFRDLPPVKWRCDEPDIRYERHLPNNVYFGGRIGREGESAVRLTLYLENCGRHTIKRLRLQTCLFLRACAEFGDFTLDNKWVHVPRQGWMPYTQAINVAPPEGEYLLGWRHGPAVADLPVIATVSNQAERLVAMTWHRHTYSLVGNPRHPCMHADPFLPDLPPGGRVEIMGHIYFHEGSLADFGVHFAESERRREA